MEIVKLGMRETKEFPHFQHGKLLSDYRSVLDVLDYIEMA